MASASISALRFSRFTTCISARSFRISCVSCSLGPSALFSSSVASSRPILRVVKASTGNALRTVFSSSLGGVASSSRQVQRMAEVAAAPEALADERLEENPLLQDGLFPRFDAVEAKHVRPGVRALLKRLENDLVELERTVQPTWPGLVEPLEKIVDHLSVVWGVVNHLKAVKDSEELRSAVEEVQPEKVAFQLRLGQSKPIYNAFKAIQEGPMWETLSEAQKRIVEVEIKEAILNGVALEGEAKTRFNEVQQELEKLSLKFGENVLDATKRFEKLITDKKDIEGLPPTALGLAAQTAASKGHEGATAENGPWIITLDLPSYLPVMQHARNRGLREELYRAYIARGSSGELDNTPVIDEILKFRSEKAKMLGYNNYAEVSMAMKMATVEKAEELLEKLRSASWESAVQDLEDLKNFAKEQGAAEADDMCHWDINFWSERLREAKYNINEGSIKFETVGHGPQMDSLRESYGLLKFGQLFWQFFLTG